jgi:transcriptional regulator with XRE-family HTH domain
VELRIGEKIKALRLASELTQAELADRARLTKGFISQLENDQSSIQIDSLADILEALGISLAEFFSDVSDEKVVFSPEERIEIGGKGASRFEILVPGSTNNLMDPILIELMPGEELEKQNPLPGEQFGFVMKGTACLHTGKQIHKVPTGHCFYFKSNCVHQIANTSNSVVKLLWITAPPQM